MTTYQDKNGTDIKTGDLVHIENGYFKNDNGLFRITRTPGDTNWLGNYLSMERINQDGTKAKSNTCGSWPLVSYTNQREKRIAAKIHNAAHATITIVPVSSLRTPTEYKPLASNLAKKEQNGIKLGDIFYSSWGYDQTNVNFYQVIGFKGDTTLQLREISGNLTSNSGYSSMAGETEPVKDAFIKEEVIEKRYNKESKSVSFSSYKSAWLHTPGKKHYVSWYA